MRPYLKGNDPVRLGLTQRRNHRLAKVDLTSEDRDRVHSLKRGRGWKDHVDEVVGPGTEKIINRHGKLQLLNRLLVDGALRPHHGIGAKHHHGLDPALLDVFRKQDHLNLGVEASPNWKTIFVDAFFLKLG